MIGMLGKKVGMTQIYKENSKLVPVTVIEAGPCSVIQIKKKDTDGYEAIQLGFDDRRESLCNKPGIGTFKKAGVTPKKFIKELRVTDIDKYKVGQAINADIFAAGDYVDITGTSKGKGFQGGVKRWGWKSGDAAHGSKAHRRVGSIESGPRLTRVTPGHHMPGHMGNKTITNCNLEIIQVNKERHLIAIKGSVPGAPNSYLIIKESKRLPKGGKRAQRRLHPTPPPKRKRDAKKAEKKSPLLRKKK